MFRFYVRLLPAVLAAWSISASAQDTSVKTVAATLSASVSSQGAEKTCGCSVIPALTPVSIEILAALGSRTSKTGDTFPIRLAMPIVIDGKVVVPAGATGMGEVIHAKKSGGMGAAGELVLAARYLEIDGQRLMLRSLNLSANGKSGIARVDALAVAAAASTIPIGVIGFFITGGQIAVPQGTVAQAKTREAFARGISSASEKTAPSIASTGRTSE